MVAIRCCYFILGVFRDGDLHKQCILEDTNVATINGEKNLVRRDLFPEGTFSFHNSYPHS